MANRQPFAPFFQQDSLRLISYCPLCETHYNPMEAKILETREDAHLIHVQCRRCRSSIIVLVMNQHGGVASVGMVTDLSAEDVLRFKGSTTVTCDDVLNLHEYFKLKQPIA
ncbi:hypothetical protein HZA86_05670 [Candidatus Uhrbacteria bacterium]|nr:hypothetical protein [Candidatus Uhrbacteria bacterium]